MKRDSLTLPPPGTKMNHEELVMQTGANQPLRSLVSFVLLLPAAAQAQDQPAAASSLVSRAEKEEFLSKANIIQEGLSLGTGHSGRVSLDDGGRRYVAGVERADGSDPSQRSYKFNVAAYELDKALALDLVPPSVERTIGGQPAALTWWVDDVAMNELERRRKKSEPPDLETWTRQMHGVRVFDELISNTYRNTSPALYLNTVWDNLLITKDWRIWLIDHTGAFRIRRQLEDPESLTQCERSLLRKLRGLNKKLLQRTLSKYLSPEQVDALEARRQLLVKHFDHQIARKGEAPVLYDLPRRQ